MDRRAEVEARAERLKKARIAAGYPSARQAAFTGGWNINTYKTHESGRAGFDNDYGREYARRFRVDLDWLMLGEEVEEHRQFIPIMGYVGAGGDVEPDFEQIPFDGLEQVELAGPIGFLDDPIGFWVRGESNMPRFNDGDIVVVERERDWDPVSLIGDEAVIRTYDGHRYIKKIMPGGAAYTYNLVSLNAPTIEGVRIAWASPVQLILPRAGIVRSTRTERPHRRGDDGTKRAG